MLESRQSDGQRKVLVLVLRVSIRTTERNVDYDLHEHDGFTENLCRTKCAGSPIAVMGPLRDLHHGTTPTLCQLWKAFTRGCGLSKLGQRANLAQLLYYTSVNLFSN